MDYFNGKHKRFQPKELVLLFLKGPTVSANTTIFTTIHIPYSTLIGYHNFPPIKPTL